MEIIKLALVLIFIAFAALQYNDPDPLLWMFIYGFVALLFLASAFQSVSKELILSTIVGLISYSCSIVRTIILTQRSFLTAKSAKSR